MVYMLQTQVDILEKEITDETEVEIPESVLKMINLSHDNKKIQKRNQLETIKSQVKILELDKENLKITERKKVLSFLNQKKNLFLTNQIKIALDKSKRLFPESVLRLEIKKDLETNEQTLFFLIELQSFVEEHLEKLHLIDESLEFNNKFIVDLYFPA